MTTRYFDGEGRAFMEPCLRHTFKWCADHHVGKVVIFTGTGEGPMFAARSLLPDYENITAVAVTPPAGRLYVRDPTKAERELVRSGVPPRIHQFLQAFGVPVISANLPFKQIEGDQASPWPQVERAYGVLGGGFALCVQAVLVACDAGRVAVGERVAAATADTAIVVLAARSETFLSSTEGLLVEHILCRPRRYTISKMNHESLAHRTAIEGSVVFGGASRRLPETDDDDDDDL
jgi:hypothetical protein